MLEEEKNGFDGELAIDEKTDVSDEKKKRQASRKPRKEVKQNATDLANKALKMNQMNTEFDDVEFEKEVPFDVFEDNAAYVEQPEAIAVDTDDDDVNKKPRKVDISELKLVEERDPITRQRDLKTALFGNKSAFQIVAAQSGYVAKMAPLVYKDSVNMLYNNLDRYNEKKSIFKVVYEKIVGFSVGKMTFDEWLKSTSVEDLETFYYGLYCATFPEEGRLNIRCPNCDTATDVNISNVNLAKTTDRKSMQKLIKDVSSKATSKEAMHEFSLLSKPEAFELADSKFVIEIRTPSLWDTLELFRMVPAEVIDRDASKYTYMLYIDRILVPKKTINGGMGYVAYTDRQEFGRIIDSMSLDDSQALRDAIADRVDNHKITYAIKKHVCPTCKHEMHDIPVSLEDILFSLVYERIQ